MQISNESISKTCATSRRRRRALFAKSPKGRYRVAEALLCALASSREKYFLHTNGRVTIVRASALFFLLIASTTALAQKREAFVIDSITGQPGERTSGFLEVPKGIDEGTTIPITIVQGVRPGPVLTLIAGVHGAEYAPIIALQRLRTQLQPQKIAGTVILVQIANLPSFLKRTIYYGPVDGKNLNRVFPGKPDGTLSERIAYTLVEKVFRRTDYLIDIHCGDSNEALIPYVA